MKTLTVYFLNLIRISGRGSSRPPRSFLLNKFRDKLTQRLGRNTRIDFETLFVTCIFFYYSYSFEINKMKYKSLRVGTQYSRV